MADANFTRNRKISGIYAIQRIGSQDCYIGQSTDIEHRWHVHRSRLRHGKYKPRHIQNVYDKHGPSIFEYVILEEVEPRPGFIDLLVEREQAWIERLRPAYNVRPAGKSNLGMRHTADSRKKMSASRLGNRNTLGYKQSAETKAAQSARQMGRKRGPMSDEQRAKISASLRGKKQTEAQRAATAARMRGMKLSADWRANISKGQMGVKRGPISEEHREAISMALSGRKRGPMSPATRDAISRAKLGVKRSEGELHGAKQAATTKS